MAGRPPKKGIDYAGWSVDVFDNDTKIDKLLDAHGWDGFGIYFYLCQRAYGGEGYFYKWGYDDCASTSRKMGGGIGSGTVRETVGYCLQIGLFDKGLFDRWGVLTSRGIQRRYWEVVKTRDVRIVISDYWLLQDDECKGLLKTPLNSNLSSGNANYPAGNANYKEGNANFRSIKESKVKESKVNKNNMCKADALALFEKLWKLYPVKKGKGQVSDSGKMKLLKIGFDEMSRAIERYKRYVDSVEYLQYQNGSTFFNSGYVDYLDANYTEQETKKNRNGFNSFPQRKYDFDKLEKELLKD
ncbi:hypothetical protein C805_00030 [Eubacterium sp. 14-2]|uniref:DUF4373 domain-containing protein n=1 Tax=Eubacterium sp. 14-2 TaxID=1235790 RepID=UPI00033BA5B7|nr:DUF4373 domain-containing protein [Eubacterium sp. 14-2]EOT29447.1 hypothetical protein C805_00030 [Eubacterium sp. 14-2]